jgi:sodium-coupled monocarboxylate transporter 8/12
MFASVICVGIKGTIDAGGMDKVWEIANEGGRIQFNDLRVDPSVRHTLWTQLIGGIFTFVSLYAVNQTQVIIPFLLSTLVLLLIYLIL